jgi:hypothetical protein
MWWHYTSEVANIVATIAQDIGGNQTAIPTLGTSFLLLDPDAISSTPIEPVVSTVPMVLSSALDVEKYYAQSVNSRISAKQYSATDDNVGFGADTWNEGKGKIVNALYRTVGGNWINMWDSIKETVEARTAGGTSVVNWHKEMFEHRNSAVDMWKTFRSALAFWNDIGIVDKPLDTDVSDKNVLLYAAADNAVKLAEALDAFEAMNTVGPYSSKPLAATALRNTLQDLKTCFYSAKTSLLGTIEKWISSANREIEASSSKFKTGKYLAEIARLTDKVALVDNYLVLDVYARAVFLLDEISGTTGVAIGIPQEDVLDKYARFLSRVWVIPAEVLSGGEAKIDNAYKLLQESLTLKQTIVGISNSVWSATDERSRYDSYAVALIDSADNAALFAGEGKKLAEDSVMETKGYYDEEKRLWDIYSSKVSQKVSQLEEELKNNPDSSKQSLLNVVKKFLAQAQAKAIEAGLMAGG